MKYSNNGLFCLKLTLSKWKFISLIAKNILAFLLSAIVFSLFLYPTVDIEYGDIYFEFYKEIDKENKKANKYYSIDIDSVLVSNRGSRHKLELHNLTKEFSIFRNPNGSKMSYMVRLENVSYEDFTEIANNLDVFIYGLLDGYVRECASNESKDYCNAVLAKAPLEIVPLKIVVSRKDFHHTSLLDLVKFIIIIFLLSSNYVLLFCKNEE